MAQLLPDRGIRNGRTCLFVLVLSAALAVPCFWQTRIQAGDLSSHVYNAWLVTLVEQGKAPGLVVVPQFTNILFDVLLVWLMKTAGIGLAQRVLVAGAVEIFFWGAVVLARAVAGRWSWFMMPCFAVLSYGWVFHTGFFNFYLSLGLSLWGLAVLRGTRGATRLGAVLLMLVAILAHALPVAWAFSVGAYAWIAERTSRRIALSAGALATIAGLRILVMARFESYATPWQCMFITGADQAWIYGPKYLPIAVLLLMAWMLLFVQLAAEKGLGNVMTSVPFHVALLTAAAVALIPTAIHFPQYRHTLWYISDRTSLATAVSLCILLSGANPPRFLKAGIAAAAAVYFSFLYLDNRTLNRIENRIEAAVNTLPPGQRVINGLAVRNSRIDPLCHMIDRACIGRCFSYSNYEASTTQFRLRAADGNAFVVSDYGESFALQQGTYVVKARDLPLYQVVCAREPERIIRTLKAGEEAQLVRMQW